MSRFPARFKIIARALRRRGALARRRPLTPQRILVAHHLLLGDTVMLTPLVAKLRALYPEAHLVMTLPHRIAPLYQRKPYGMETMPYDPRDPASIDRLLALPAFDLAFVPGDNRYSWLALAMGARWIVAFDGDRPNYKSWPVDELVPYPQTPAAWGDMVAGLWPGPPPQPYKKSAWPAPDHAPFSLPPSPYCVFHIGASSALKRWPSERWRELAEHVMMRGLTPVWSAGRGEEHEVATIDPAQRYQSYAARLDLPQLWHLLARARLLVCPDTGIAHLARLIGTPTVALFGPGSSVISGAGQFWQNGAFAAVTIDDFPCRDQNVLFKRNIAWARRCARSTSECPTPACMLGIGLGRVERAIDILLKGDASFAGTIGAVEEN